MVSLDKHPYNRDSHAFWNGLSCAPEIYSGIFIFFLLTLDPTSRLRVRKLVHVGLSAWRNPIWKVLKSFMAHQTHKFWAETLTLCPKNTPHPNVKTINSPNCHLPPPDTPTHQPTRMKLLPVTCHMGPSSDGLPCSPPSQSLALDFFGSILCCGRLFCV